MTAASPEVGDAIGEDASHNEDGGNLPVFLYMLM
jgi:hypothetical protein